jgi:hydrogenase maturation protease
VRLDLLACGGLDLLSLLDGARVLVVVDAVCLGARPGTLHVLDWSDLPAAGPAVSAHGIGVREALAAGSLLRPRAMPRRVTLVGIEGQSFDGLGAPLSAPVAAAVPRAARAALRAVRQPEGG